MRASADTSRAASVGRRVFWAQTTLGSLGAVVVTAALAVAATSVHRESANASGLTVAGLHLTYPTVNVAAAVLLAVAVLGAVVLILAARACWRLWNDHRRFMAALDVVGPLPGHPEVTVIEDPKLTAFCAGFVHPKVYISRGVLRLLSREETDAVLLHERHHCGTRDPLRLAFASVLTQALFFLPLVRRLRESYAELAEAGADQAAVRAHQGDSGAMASALLAFDAEAPPGTAGISSQRVDSLLGQPPPWGVSAWLVAIGLCSLAGLVVVVWLTSEAASAGASFNLPIISSNPCALVLALLPLVAGATALIGRGRLFPVRKHS